MKFTSQNNAIIIFPNDIIVAFKTVNCSLLEVQKKLKSWI